MDTFRLLFLISMGITSSQSSESDQPLCEDYGEESFYLLEGEAFYFVHDDMTDSNFPDKDITWYKNDSQIENISTDEKEMVHYHGGALFFLNLHTEDSGVYIARHKPPSGDCSEYYLKIIVFKAGPSENKALLYGSDEDMDNKIECPSPVEYTCKELNGNYTWEKDSKPLEGHRAELRVNNTKDKEGIYTCICTWEHNKKKYKSSGSRRLIAKDPVLHRSPVILSPTNKEQFADEGFEIKLNCSVFCGTNVEHACTASWLVDGDTFKQANGYHLTPSRVNQNAAKNTISTMILTIEKVSAKDFQSKFQCLGVGFFRTANSTLTLKHRESIIPLVICGVCVFAFCVFAVVLVKSFAIELALCFRPYFPLVRHNKDTRVYDAYVVYQMQSMDKVTEDTLCQFVTNNLPSVLEEKCGYRLFIQGRDDIPGEDRLELVEDRMKQSRRLMVILTPGSQSGTETTDQQPASSQNSVIGGFDWQVGLHHVLVQRQMSVILIQLGKTEPQGYTHLPPGLQHLILKSAPVRWPEGSRGAAAWNSHFWKRVRYLMPARPAKKCQQSSII